jgi:hypothetical protein
MKRALFGGLAALGFFALSACGSAPVPVEEQEVVGTSEDPLICTNCGGGTGGGGVFDPGPTYCRTVNPSCTIATRSWSSIDCNIKGCLSSWCTSPKSYTLPGYLPMNVANCPDTTAVRSWVAYSNSRGRGAVFSTSACDNCLSRPSSGRGYVIYTAVSGPTCGSGCLPPW